MSRLRAISPTKEALSKPKMLLYGRSGIGKTTFCLQFPKPYYIDTEDGASFPDYQDLLQKSGGAYYGVKQGSLLFDEVIEEVKALCSEKHEYKTLVIDSITKIQDICINSEQERLKKTGTRNAFGADRKPAISYMRQLIAWISKLDMTVVLICHEKNEWGTDKHGTRTEIGKTFDGWEKIEYELDLALNIIERDGKRYASVRSSRLNSLKEGSFFDFSYDAFAKLYGEDIITRQTVPLVLATKEQVDEITKLLSVVQLPEKTQEKWLSKAEVQDFSEMTSDQINNCINYLKGKIS